MRYSKWALLLFGAGLVLGLVVVSARLSGGGPIASAAMMAGIVLLPLAFVADWWRKAAARVTRRTRAPSRPRRAASSRTASSRTSASARVARR